MSIPWRCFYTKSTQMPRQSGALCLTATCALSRRPLRLTGATRRCLNLGSYNYLGFAAADEYCTPRVLDTMRRLGWSMCSSRTDAGQPLKLKAFCSWKEFRECS